MEQPFPSHYRTQQGGNPARSIFGFSPCCPKKAGGVVNRAPETEHTAAE